MSEHSHICIGNIAVGGEYPPFIIAEMSGNHNQSLERALERRQPGLVSTR